MLWYKVIWVLVLKPSRAFLMLRKMKTLTSLLMPCQKIISNWNQISVHMQFFMNNKKIKTLPLITSPSVGKQEEKWTWILFIHFKPDAKWIPNSVVDVCFFFLLTAVTHKWHKLDLNQSHTSTNIFKQKPAIHSRSSDWKNEAHCSSCSLQVYENILNQKHIVCA